MAKKKKSTKGTTGAGIIDSPNFGFLAAHDEVLVTLGALAEQYVFEDPNTSIMKVRQLAEALAKNAAAIVGIHVGQRDTQADIIRRLVDKRYADEEVEDILHTIRKSGNDATHNFGGSRYEALRVLELGRDLAIWFHRSFKDPSFKAGPFVRLGRAEPPPVMPEEIEELRHQLAIQQTETDSAKQTALEEADGWHNAEKREAALEEERDLALALAAENENLVAKIKSFEERLAPIERNAEKQPAAELEVFASNAEKAAAQIQLSDEEKLQIGGVRLLDSAQQAMKPAGKPIEITVPAVLFRITKVYREGMTPNEIYDAVRGTWKVDARRNSARYAVAVFNGMVKGIFEINKWHPAGTTEYRTRNGHELKKADRWEFTGNHVDQKMWFEYLDRSVAKYFPAGSGPVTYVNLK